MKLVLMGGMAMNALVLYITFLLLISSSYSYTHNGVFIVIHGTWASEKEWAKTEGAFFDALEISAAQFNKKVISFVWNGKIDHNNRVAASKSLVKLIQSYPDSFEINVVAHSHGGNVGILASQQLAALPGNKYRINSFYTLGTPVDSKLYLPNMDIIHRFYSFFSFADWVQPVLGIFERLYPQHPRIANICVTINGKEPGHLDLTDPLIATWLPSIHQQQLEHKDGIEHFDFRVPGAIHFRVVKAGYLP